MTKKPEPRWVSSAFWSLVTLLSAFLVVLLAYSFLEPAGYWIPETWGADQLAAGAQLIAAVTALAALIAAVSLARDSARVRLHTQEQVEILREQSESQRQQLEILQSQERLRLAPFITVTVESALDYLLEQGVDEEEILAESARYYATVTNQSENVALEVSMFVYDWDNKNYLSSRGVFEFILPRKERVIKLEEIVHREELTRRVLSRYRVVPDEAESLSRAGDHSYMLVFFLGVDGQPYVYVRSFGPRLEGHRPRRAQRRQLTVQQPETLPSDDTG